MPENLVLAATLDYGDAIKDLCAANIFPGDLFTKNFGVTRHGSVVFYDYDELTLLQDPYRYQRGTLVEVLTMNWHDRGVCLHLAIENRNKSL